MPDRESLADMIDDDPRRLAARMPDRESLADMIDDDPRRLAARCAVAEEEVERLRTVVRTLWRQLRAPEVGVLRAEAPGVVRLCERLAVSDPDQDVWDFLDGEAE